MTKPGKSAADLRSRVLAGVLLGLASVCVALACWAGGLLTSFEASSYDLRVRFMAEPAPTTDEIRVILLDQQSLDWAQKEFGLGWPWPRQVYAPIIDFCRRAEAKSLAFDVVFTEPSVYGVSDDATMAKAMESYGRTVLPIDLRLTDGSDEHWPDGIPEPGHTVIGFKQWPAHPHVKRNLASFPIPELAGKAIELGNVNNAPEPDTIYRRLAPMLHFDGHHVPALPLASYLAAHSESTLAIEGNDLKVDGRTIELDNEGMALLNYRGGTKAYAPISAAAVIQSELRLAEGGQPVIDPADFKDKYVFFGFSATGLLDLRHTPMGGVTPGVILNATALDNMLAGDFLRRTPTWTTIAFTLIMGLGIALWHVLVRNALSTGFIALLALALPAGICIAAYGAGWWLPLIVQIMSAALALSTTGIYKYATEGRQKRFIKSAFKQYLSPQVIEQLLDDPDRLQLGGERREISIFFSDLQGFTTISESLDPEELTAVLNEYLSAMTDIIQEEGGTVDKYEGDAIIAFWNAPVDQSDHARRAVRAALRCQTKLTEQRAYFRERTGHDFHMRIGLNTGPAVVGNLGSATRFDYTMLGDAVNLAARLEGANKQFGTYTMISQATLDGLNDPEGRNFQSRELARLQVVGKNQAVVVHEPFLPQQAPERLERDAAFARGLAAYYAGDFAKAAKDFESSAEQDPAARKYADRCNAMDTPPADWDGVWTLTSK